MRLVLSIAKQINLKPPLLSGRYSAKNKNDYEIPPRQVFE